jgi:hypothetical protein
MHMTFRKPDGDAGAVAVIVALTTVLLFSVGALAIDIGNGYARKRASQTTADLAALAGAAQLGVDGGVAAARKAAIDYIRDKNVVQSDDGAAIPACTITSATSSCWDNDGNENNGEITFSDDTGVATTGIGATRIRVVTPRREVKFGLGGVMGFNDVTVQKAATAGIFSPGGGATPPFYLSVADAGMTCIKDESSGGGPNPAAVRAAFAQPHAVNASTTITSASPDTNTTQELTAFSLTLTGANMDNTDTVRFHNNATNVNYDLTGASANIMNRGSGKFVDVDVPNTIPAGTYTISVAQGATFGGSYNYILKAKPVPTPPTITAVTPNPGTEQSTAQFTLTGTNLKGTGATVVSFGGGGNATAVVPNAAGTSLTANFPAMPAGTYPVTVQNSLGTSTTTYSYTANALPKPSGITLTPALGPANGGTTVVITGSNLPTNPTTASVTFNGTPVTAISAAGGSLTVTTPAGVVGLATVYVYNGSTQSDPATFTYTKDAVSCQADSSNRGYIDEPRFDTNGSGPVLIENIKSGIDHGLHTYQTYLLPPNAAARAEPPLGAQCDTVAVPSSTVLKSGSTTPLQNVNCVRLASGGKSSFEKGFFDSPDGRLYQYQSDTGSQTGSIGGHSNVDIDDLFDTRFVDAANMTAFRAAIIAGLPPTTNQLGWIKDAIFSCPRFALLPVVNVDDATTPDGTAYFPIVGFKGMFITSINPGDPAYDHGFAFQGGSMQGVKGFVFDLKWLHKNVSSSEVLGTQAYVGTGPVVAKLVRDKDDNQPAGTY